MTAQNLTGHLARFAARLENTFDRIKGPVRDPRPALQPYLGYSTSSSIVLRGRVLSLKQKRVERRRPTFWNNIRAMALNFMTVELADVAVTAGPVSTKTDEEGYFTLQLPREAYNGPSVTLSLPDFAITAEAEAVIADPDAHYGIISDIDDTIMQTGAWRLHRNIWTTLTGHETTRHVFPDSVRLLDHLHAGLNPVFYVSSSPWNLYNFLAAVFDRNKVVRGPKFLRDLGISETQFIKGSHGAHKGSAIDTIFAANPDLPFELIGDTGQHDAQVYLDAIKRHPGRVRRVLLRAAGTVDDRDAAAAQAIRDTGVDCFVGSDFTSLV